MWRCYRGVKPLAKCAELRSEEILDRVGAYGAKVAGVSEVVFVSLLGCRGRAGLRRRNRAKPGAYTGPISHAIINSPPLEQNDRLGACGSRVGNQDSRMYGNSIIDVHSCSCR